MYNNMNLKLNIMFWAMCKDICKAALDNCWSEI